MKKVISGENLTIKMQEAINLLCGTVKTTLGPKGNNIIIDHSTFSPFITNDGVTIAENIESDDEVVNTILELAKEASIKTNDNVGDGTTTTLVLLENIFNNGLEYIKKGINPLQLKKQLDLALQKVLKEINSYARKPKENDYTLIAQVSANDENIGSLISEVYNKIKKKSAITLKESQNEETYVNYNKGYIFDTILASPYFLNKTIDWIEPYCLVLNEPIYDLESISKYLNIIYEKQEKLVIIAKDYSDELVNEIVSLYLENKINIILLKTPLFGIQQQEFYEDLKIILDNFNFGKIRNIKINKEKTLLSFKENNKIKDYVTKLKLQRENNDNDNRLEDLNLRIAYLTNGTAEIVIGAPTDTERREKKMRFIDALWAIEEARKGILSGSGLSLLKVSDNIKSTDLGFIILKEALKKPLEQILLNAGFETKEIIDKIRNNNYEIIFNVKEEKFENILDTTVIDPLEVVTNALKNACSIAGMLLTTSSLVVNEYQNNLNKEIEFNEL